MGIIEAPTNEYQTGKSPDPKLRIMPCIKYPFTIHKSN